MNSAANLGREFLVFKDHCVINLTSLEKQSRPGHVRGYLRVQKFSEDPELCPSQTLSEYFTKTRELNPNATSFFVSLQKPHSGVTSQTLARWTTELLTAAGIDTSIFSPHATRSAAGALLSRKLTSVQICKLADWSTSSGVYEKFYNLYV